MRRTDEQHVTDIYPLLANSFNTRLNIPTKMSYVLIQLRYTTMDVVKASCTGNEDLVQMKDTKLKKTVILISLALILVLTIPTIAVANDYPDGTPVPEVPAFAVPLALFAVLAASVWLLRKKSYNIPVLMKAVPFVLLVFVIVVLVSSTVAYTATGFLSAVNLTTVVVMAAIPVTWMVALITLHILRTGKKRLAGVFRIHLSLTKLLGYILDIFGLNVDPHAEEPTSRFLSTVVGTAFNVVGRNITY